MNQFGGNWTEDKMKIVVEYAQSYLTIMNKQDWARTLYFDGFAGSGVIEVNENKELIKGTALRILDLNDPRPFDKYYFVEKDEKHKLALDNIIKSDYPKKVKIAKVVEADCNDKLIAMAKFLKSNKTYRVLAFIDPYGMSVDWKSIEALQGLGIDLWILVPTGVGVNRLLKTDGNISEAWLVKLKKFLGLSENEIFNHFYYKTIITTLFGEETLINKEKSAVQKAGVLYTQQLKKVFKYVSESYVMRNSNNSIMYHLMMATNNEKALKIANHVSNLTKL